MSRPFTLPDLGEGLTEAEIVKVLVREGDVIAEYAPLLEVETDKAPVKIPSPMSGGVEKIHVEPHQTVKVGQVLVTFADAAAGAGKPAGKQAADTLDPTRTLAPEPRTTVQGTRARQAPTAEPARTPARSFEPAEAGAAAGGGAAAPPRGFRARVPPPGVARAARAGGRGPAATPAPAKPLATHVTEPPLPNFEQ